MFDELQRDIRIDQPSRVRLEEKFRIDAIPDELAGVILNSVYIIEYCDA